MFYRLFLITILLTGTNAIAQHKNTTPSKTTEKQDDPKIDYKQVDAPMPELGFVPVYNTKNTTNDHKEFMTGKELDNGANFFVMMFNPTCSHCQGQTMLFEKNDSLFKKTKIVLLANPIMKSYMQDFIELTHIDQYPFMYLGIDSLKFIDNVFLYQSLPQINIYSPDRKLIRTYTGEVSMDTLKKYIQ